MKMSLTNKIDFAVVFKVKNANPNGDPLNGNRPRTNYDQDRGSFRCLYQTKNQKSFNGNES